MPREYDEDDVPSRPSGRNRPRSKQRPAHKEAKQARVTTIDRGRITCSLTDGSETCIVAVRARELGRKSVAVGDTVGLIGDTSGTHDTLARLVRIDERQSVLRRTADDNDPYERIIVANVNQMAVIVACADPPPRVGLIDRCLAAAYDARINPLLVMTKTDLANPDEFLAQYASLDIPVFPTQPGSDLSEIREHLTGQSTVLVGHSGVGKSTLINTLIPAAHRQTGQVNDVTGRGRHTSTSAQAFSLADGGWIVDTPGVRSFGLAHLDVNRVVCAFADLAGGIDDCPRSCTHDEPECGLDAWISNGHADPARLDSLRRILRAHRDTSVD